MFINIRGKYDNMFVADESIMFNIHDEHCSLNRHICTNELGCLFQIIWYLCLLISQRSVVMSNNEMTVDFTTFARLSMAAVTERNCI